MPTGECMCLAVSWDMPQSQQLPLYCLNRKTFFAVAQHRGPVPGVTQMLWLSVLQWDFGQSQPWRRTKSQTDEPQQTSPFHLGHCGPSCLSAWGSTWPQRCPMGHLPTTLPPWNWWAGKEGRLEIVPKAQDPRDSPILVLEVLHVGYGTVGGTRVIHPSQTNAELCKVAQHPYTPSSFLSGLCVWTKFWQPMKIGLREIAMGHVRNITFTWKHLNLLKFVSQVILLIPFFGIFDCSFNNMLFIVYDLLQKKEKRKKLSVMYLTALEWHKHIQVGY